jgi:hypothetical protein
MTDDVTRLCFPCYAGDIFRAVRCPHLTASSCKREILFQYNNFLDLALPIQHVLQTDEIGPRGKITDGKRQGD